MEEKYSKGVFKSNNSLAITQIKRLADLGVKGACCKQCNKKFKRGDTFLSVGKRDFSNFSLLPPILIDYDTSVHVECLFMYIKKHDSKLTAKLVEKIL